MSISVWPDVASPADHVTRDPGAKALNIIEEPVPPTADPLAWQANGFGKYLGPVTNVPGVWGKANEGQPSVHMLRLPAWLFLKVEMDLTDVPTFARFKFRPLKVTSQNSLSGEPESKWTQFHESNGLTYTPPPSNTPGRWRRFGVVGTGWDQWPSYPGLSQAPKETFDLIAQLWWYSTTGAENRNFSLEYVTRYYEKGDYVEVRCVRPFATTPAIIIKALSWHSRFPIPPDLT